MTDVTLVADHRGSNSPNTSAKDATQIAYAGDDVLRATVHKDFYAFQSKATVEVWRDGWQQVIYLAGTDVEDPDITLPKLYALATLVLQPPAPAGPEPHDPGQPDMHDENFDVTEVYSIEIEEDGTPEGLAADLRVIADQLDAGLTSSYSPCWNLVREPS